MIEYIESHGILHLFNNCFLVDVAQPLQTLLTPDSFDHRVNRDVPRFGKAAHQGILTVSAKDWGTSQEKSIRIEETGTSGTGLRRHPVNGIGFREIFDKRQTTEYIYKCLCRRMI